jgi:hypothetical protein
MAASIASATGRRASLLLVAALFGAVGAVAGTADAATPFEQMRPLGAEQLQRMRGGFIDSSGLMIRFGFDTSIRVNNELQQRVVVSPILVAPNVPGVEVTRTNSAGVTTTQQISTGALARAPIEFRELVNGGMTSLSTAFGPNGALSVVQNRANNTLVQRTTTFNFDITGMRAILANHAAANMMMRGLATRAVFGR